MEMLRIIKLNDGIPLTEIRVWPEILNQILVWCIEMDGTKAIIRKDDSGIWMQRSIDNLAPEFLAQVGGAIQDCYVFEHQMTS